MGILDDVTFAEEPKFPLGSKGSFVVSDEDLETINNWLDDAMDSEKTITVDGAVSRTDYEYNRIPVRDIFKSWRISIVNELELTNEVRPVIINFYTLSYSNSEEFEYTHSASLNPHDDFKKMYHIAVVLKGTFKTNKLENPLSEKENYFVFSNEEEEIISNSGESDSRILFINLGTA